MRIKRLVQVWRWRDVRVCPYCGYRGSDWPDSGECPCCGEIS